MTHTTPGISDAAERERALDPRRSFLVQAPAGSGKTELLALRYLALLPTVDEPEHILAITFARKAAAEMRTRVVRALGCAHQPEDPDADDHQREVRRLAQLALARSEERGWQLLEQPQRLNIQTIDALALSIAYQTPLLSRLGGRLNPTEDARPLYALAAERTMAHLGSPTNSELAGALDNILKLRDANLQDAEALIAGMLERREQWLLLLPGIVMRNRPWEDLRAQLEAPFEREHAAVLGALAAEFARTPDVLPELLDLARIAYSFGTKGVAPLLGLHTAAELTDPQHWQAFSCMLLTGGGTWRKKSVITVGNSPANAMRCKAVVNRLSANHELLNLLHAVRELPPAHYSPEEWETVRSIFVVLRHAIAELRVVFAEQDVIDFAEAGIAAHAALNHPNVLMRLEEQVHHLLIDEFQDTSRPHYALLRALIENWQPGEGRTCFVVGDPMQSIYLFRDAESRLFNQVRERGIEIGGTHLDLEPVQLSTNFRSTPAIVRPLNEIFEQVLTGTHEDDVPFAPSVSNKPADPGTADAVHLRVQILEKNASADALNAQEADAMLAVIREHQHAIEEAQRTRGKYRVAVLGRTRNHLTPIIRRLRDAGIPFRSVKIDMLRNRPEILDLLSLLRALLHPADRIAWLAVLRAPWCGLEIPALHALCGDLPNDERDRSIPALFRLHQDRLDAESRRRALHVLSILEEAQAAYAQGALAGSPAGLALWLERTWHALGAPRFLNHEALANCESFFTTLTELPASCFGTLDDSLNRRLEELFAQPSPDVSEECGVQLMTIHGAKGLEFEVVLVPQLQRPGKPDDSPLFRWLVRRRPGSAEEELLLAPIGFKNGETPRLFDWIGKKLTRRLKQEEKRLLYVACTRAIQELHLFATLKRGKNGELGAPPNASLLAAGIDGLSPRIAAEIQRIAASNVITMPIPTGSSSGIMSTLAASASSPSQMLRRLPLEHFRDVIADLPGRSALMRTKDVEQESSTGSRLARIQGTVLHALLEQAASVASPHADWPRLVDTLLRQYGLTPADAAAARSAILHGLRNTLDHAEGRWLLAADAVNGDRLGSPSWTEISWTGVAEGRVFRKRPDRVFFGGSSPMASGTEYLWIIDYKTASPPEGGSREQFLTTSREQYRAQLESYSALFRQLSALDPDAETRSHRLAIYHPMLPWLDWWAG